MPHSTSSRDRSGRIRQPDAEIVVVGPGISRVERLVPGASDEAPRGWMPTALGALGHRVTMGLRRYFGRWFPPAQETRSTLRLGSTASATIQIPPELIGGRREVALVDLSSDRPRLTLLPGMRGTIEIGVSAVDAAAILGDPSLRRPSGEATYALPWGARATLELGPWRFIIRPA